MDLYYSIQKTNDLKMCFEVICFSGIKKGVRVDKDPLHRAYSFETIKTCLNPLEENLLAILLKEKRVSSDFSRFAVGKEQAKKVLKALMMTCKCVHKGELCSFYFDQKGAFHIRQEEGQFHLYLNEERIGISEVFAIPEAVIYRQKAFYQYAQLLSNRLLNGLDKQTDKNGAKKFYEEFEDEIPFINVQEQKKSIDISPVPILKLSDKTGAFANLGFYYDQEIIFFHDQAKKLFRNFQEEKLWEEDLLKAGFVKKMVVGSHYYCPMDKVAKSLTTLLDCGWEIIDTYGRKVVRGQPQMISFHLQQERVHLDGKMNFYEKEIDISDVYGAFCRRQSFLDLGNNQVGLIEASLFKNMEDLGVEIDESTKDVKFHRGAFFQLKELFQESKINFNEMQLPVVQEIKTTGPLELNGFGGLLYPYQKLGVEWLLSLFNRRMHGLLADDMGLGKTVQVIAFLSAIHFKKGLIVVPTSLLLQWEREIKKFNANLKVKVFHGKSRSLEIEDESTIFLTTYGLIRDDIKTFSKESFDLVILDEAQAIKNNESLASQSVKQLKAGFKLSITGTPIENNLMELYAHFDFLLPGLMKKEKMLHAELDPFAKKKIKELINPYFMRRKKGDVLKDLPEKIEQIIYVEMEESERLSYEQVLKAEKGNKNQPVLEAILRLRQHCCYPRLVNPKYGLVGSKFDKVLQDILEILTSDQKVIVYSSFVSVLKSFQKQFLEYGINALYLDGSIQNRQELVDQFQNEPDKKIFLISLKAGGIGLNLSAADYVFIYDPWWNESAENQAIDRAHRIGREKVVIARRYILAESIEEKILSIKEKKSNLFFEMIERNEIKIEEII